MNFHASVTVSTGEGTQLTSQRTCPSQFYMKVYKRKWTDPMVQAPHMLILAMAMVVKMDELNQWIHLSHCSPAKEPGRSLNVSVHSSKLTRTMTSLVGCASSEVTEKSDLCSELFATCSAPQAGGWLSRGGGYSSFPHCPFPFSHGSAMLFS